MKKIMYVLLIISFMFISYVYAENSVEIKSIELDSKSDNVIINNEPTYSGLEMNFDIAFKEKGDFVRYKAVIINNTDKEYTISDDTSFNESSYITYTYQSDSILKANSEGILYVTITYNNEISDNLLVSGKYSESNKAVVQLLNDNEEVVEPSNIENESDIEKKIDNPKTWFAFPLIVLIVVIISTLIASILLLNKKSVIKYMVMIFIFGIGIIPIIVLALEKLSFTINVNVEILKTYKVYYAADVYSRFFYTDEELNDIGPSNLDCNTYYIGSKTEENKYNRCVYKYEYVVRGEYAAGEVVNIITTHIRDFYIDNDSLDNYCEEESDGSYLCIGDIKHTEWDNIDWFYNPSLEYAHRYTDEEMEEFARYLHVSDYSNYHDWMIIYSPATFIMPDSDIYFDMVPPV